MSSTIQPLSCDQGGMQFPHRSRVGAHGGGQQQVNSNRQSFRYRPFDGEAPAPGGGGRLTHQPFNYSPLSIIKISGLCLVL